MENLIIWGTVVILTSMLGILWLILWTRRELLGRISNDRDAWQKEFTRIGLLIEDYHTKTMSYVYTAIEGLERKNKTPENQATAEREDCARLVEKWAAPTEDKKALLKRVAEGIRSRM